MHAARRTGSPRCAAVVAVALTLAGTGARAAEDHRPLSPRGTATTEVLGKWAEEGGRTRYTGGKRIEVEYGRPIKRGREDLFGSGADFGAKLRAGAPVWRVGADQTTRLTTEVGLEIGGKKIKPGTYSVQIDLKEGGWILILSTQPAAAKYDPSDKKATWGSYNYDPKFDVVRAPMKAFTPGASIDQLTIGFADVGSNAGKLAIAWDRQGAYVDFKIAP